jgi:hypothetical protein
MPWNTLTARGSPMVICHFVVAVRAVDRHQSFVDDEEVHPLPVNPFPLHHLKDFRDISSARHRQIHLLSHRKHSPDLPDGLLFH